MFWLINLSLVLVGAYLLVRGADMAVEHAVRFSRKFGISELIVGATVVALGTSLPEWTVSVLAAWQGQADVAFGNVLGSNLANIGLILAIALIPKAIPVESQFLRWDGVFFVGTAAALIGLVYKGQIDIYIGLSLISLLIIYLSGVLRTALSQRGHGLALEQSGMYGDETGIVAEPMDLHETEFESKAGTSHIDSEIGSVLQPSFLVLILGFVHLVVGSKAMVDGAVAIAHKMEVAEWIIGITMVSLGTSLPELAATIAAMGKGSLSMTLGNVVGSNIWNTYFILGSVGLVGTADVKPEMMFDVQILMAMSALLLLSGLRGRLGRVEAGIIASLYGVCIWHWVGAV